MQPDASTEMARKLRAFIAKRVPRDLETDDILQTVFLRLQERGNQVRDSARLLPWLFSIARNAIADHYRSAERRRTRTVGDARSIETRATGFGVDSESAEAARGELAACLRPMLQKLPPGNREAVLLVELDGLLQKDAAMRLGLSLSGLKSRIQRGRAQLKQALGECCRIQLDRRHSVVDFEPREKCRSC
jgi:RNA polymerase sigma-70 factor (ECF subfamily)